MYCTVCQRECAGLLPAHQFCGKCGCPSTVHKPSGLTGWLKTALGGAGGKAVVPAPPTPPVPPAPPVKLPPIPQLPVRRGLVGVVLDSLPVAKPQVHAQMADTQQSLDLSKTAYGIRATLQRNPDSSIDAVVQTGAALRAQLPGSARWHAHASGDRVPVTPGIVLFDQQGKLTIKISGSEK